ncbi:hypothetical protein CC1G_04775 [Coprinopsis cinerea okayama7|uniref:F-box domain-containing protein n=1 Tax=Coprinopsis cinerea (strain Okayama-7 / 130 / ATCC MYA-4618 / FGSC 9003) TaxID=240176 RepID=A8P2I8_COPC7|nr:hypothetical protein CC1G_04775 [Coprinopsis cinerea okayama7\|eukprot:XP_001838331.2 hypothetical protein CC1G_04775 [Coprinopsis cinerea okayama7\
MTTPDLPPEIWQEILSHGSPSAVMKMMGVSRFLFERALDYKYEGMRLISDGEREIWRFEQLNKPSIARRVQRLYIRPTFLPAKPTDPPPETSTPVRQYLADARRACLKVASGLWNPTRTGTDLDKPVDATSRLLAAAANSLPNCSNLTEISLVVHDLELTDKFISFLHTLWSAMGKQVRRFSLATTCSKFPALLATTFHDEQHHGIESLEFVIANSRFSGSSESQEAGESRRPSVEEKKASTAMSQFISLSHRTLTHLSISTVQEFDLSQLFSTLALTPFPRLSKFELHCHLNTTMPSNSQTLVDLLDANKQSLEHLCLYPRTGFGAYYPVASSLDSWLNKEFTQLTLPKLHTLEVGLRPMFDWTTQSPITLPKLVPAITPQLQALVIKSEGGFGAPEVRNVLEMTEGKLERLEIYVHKFTLAILDSLANELTPKLQSLTVAYDKAAGCRYELEERATLRYPKWPLKQLRVGYKKSCGMIHPDPEMAEAIAQAVPGPVEVDVEYICPC